jgi:hypothetical protein
MTVAVVATTPSVAMRWPTPLFFSGLKVSYTLSSVSDAP